MNWLKRLYYKITKWNYISWFLRGKPMIKYKGFTCGCCGKGWKIPFEIRDYKTCGEWGDTWGLCPENKGCRKNERERL